MKVYKSEYINFYICLSVSINMLYTLIKNHIFGCKFLIIGEVYGVRNSSISNKKPIFSMKLPENNKRTYISYLTLIFFVVYLTSKELTG